MAYHQAETRFRTPESDHTKNNDNKGSIPKQNVWQGGLSTKELDKVAQNINTFTLSPSCGYDIHAYFQDIDFYLQKIEHGTVQEKNYLIRGTLSQEIHSFHDWQPDKVKTNPKLLHEALIKECSDPETRPNCYYEY